MRCKSDAVVSDYKFQLNSDVRNKIIITPVLWPNDGINYGQREIKSVYLRCVVCISYMHCESVKPMDPFTFSL